jgi:hypothetical protein
MKVRVSIDFLVERLARQTLHLFASSPGHVGREPKGQLWNGDHNG